MAARGDKWWVLAVVNLPLFMALLDRGLVVIAIPRIIEDLGGGLADASWIINGYILAFVVALVIGGRMGDLWGRRRLLLVGVAAFTFGSITCALAADLPMLIGARAVQGLGGAVMLPQTLSLLMVAFPAGQRGLSLGLWSSASGLGTALGPILGGLLVGLTSWRAVFLVNLPVAVVAFVGALRLVPESRAENAGRRLDWLGMALIVVLTASVTFAVIEGQGLGWGSPAVVGHFALAAASAALLYFVERGRSNALIPPSLFGDRAFTAANLDGLLSFFGFVGVTFLVPIFLQGQAGRSALTAGVLLTPLPVALMAASAASGRLTDHLGGRPLVFAGMSITAAGIFMLGGLTPQAESVDLLVPLAIVGLGVGTALAPTATVVMTSVHPTRFGNASGILGTFRMFGAVLGVAVMSAVFEHRLLAGLRVALEGASIAPAEKQRLLEQAGEGAQQMLFAGTRGGSAEASALVARELMAALAAAFGVAAGLSLLGALIALLIPARAGEHRPVREIPRRLPRGARRREECVEREGEPMSRTRSILGLLGFLAVTFAIGAGASAFAPDLGGSTWYESLPKAPWNPPGWAFGPAWTVLYVLMSVAAWLVWRARGSLRAAAFPLSLYALQLVLNGLWTLLFFGQHLVFAALADIAVLLAAIGATLAAFWRVRRAAGALLVPYLLWVAFAASLNAYIVARL